MNDSSEGIIIVGMPRSGTTLLRRLLNAHPNIACPPETYLFSGASRMLEEHRFAGGLSVGVVPGLGFSGFGEDEILARLRTLIFGFLQDVAGRSGKARWAEKTAIDIFHVGAIERLCGDRCKYVCIVRHPLDVVCSIKELSDKMEMYLPELHSYIQKYPAPLEAFAHAWVDCNRRMLELNKAHPRNCILVRYEDLTSNLDAELERIFEFLGEDADVDEVVRRSVRSRDSVGLGDWKTYDKDSIETASVGRHASLGKWTINTLSRIVGPLAEVLGYGHIEVNDEESAAAVRRREELARLVASMKLSAATRGGSDA